MRLYSIGWNLARELILEAGERAIFVEFYFMLKHGSVSVR